MNENILKLSRKKNKTETEIKVLREYIILLVKKIQTNKIEFLSDLFIILEPMFKIMCKSFCWKHKNYTYSELYNQCYIILYDLILKYDNSTFFLYYIKKMTHWSLTLMIQKEKLYQTRYHSYRINTKLLPNIKQDTQEKVYDNLNFNIFLKEYYLHIDILIHRKYRSINANLIIIKYFLNLEEISKISKDLNISYHAVYEIIHRITFNLVEFINQNKFISYSIDSSNIFSQKQKKSVYLGYYKIIKR